MISPNGEESYGGLGTTWGMEIYPTPTSQQPYKLVFSWDFWDGVILQGYGELVDNALI